MKILFASSEILPYAKSGGLADVADALPQALSEFEDVIKVMPLYSFISKDDLEFEYGVSICLGATSYDVKFYTKTDYGLVTYFVDAPFLSTTKNLYAYKDVEYENNDLRFGIFCKAIVELAQKKGVDILHLNDWHTALSALYIKEKKLKIKTVFTIHNLAYQGIFDKSSLEKLDIDTKYFTMEGLEFHSKVNFLKAGIAYSDALSTVSKTYAKEILTKKFGCGLDGFLKNHKKRLSGILNGINTTLFNPRDDESLYLKYDEKTYKNKTKNKKKFIKKSALKDSKLPLFVMVTRLAEQKGIDLFIKSLKKLLKKKLNIFIIGEGDSEYSSVLHQFSERYDNLDFVDTYDESLSHKTYAAADFLLMPSKFEPCGLSQMIAMSYGAIPIVHGVGGLKESVKDKVDGIVYKKQTKKELLLAVDKALKLKKKQ